ncbi:MAG: HIT family protein [Bacilli bacterium]|nr:HIT family protein [Bacilli bacterium]
MDDIFCKIARGDIPSCKVYEDEYVLAFLDLGQVTKGHTLVIPKKHSTNILDCDEEYLGHVFKAAQKVANALIKTYGATGVNILSNANESAGQSVFHFHVHIIPRYGNDEYLELGFKEHDTSNMDLKAMAEEIAKNI